MKYFLTILLLTVLFGLGLGFYIKSDDEVSGNFIIGASIAVGFFVLMPLFIYHRWKGKNIKDYMLTKENIEKMQKYQKDNKV